MPDKTPSKKPPFEKRRILITSAFPYANGDIHIGHMVEHFITDYFGRFQKMRGHDCIQLCADDTHGTPILIGAKKRGITPEELIAEQYQRHVADFHDFHIGYDEYGSTHSSQNQEYCDAFFEAMSPYATKKTTSQFFCEFDGMFLPDRLVKGTCPKCQAEEQYGDQCEKCATTYSPVDLTKPYCSICQKTPVLKDSEHVYFQLESFRSFLKTFAEQAVDDEVRNKLQEWLAEPLKDWCLTRDKPYFGFPVKGLVDKYYYVWMDAPIGYVATTKTYCQRVGRDVYEFWQDPQAEIYHNCGKDVMYFHTLFWPAMLKVHHMNVPKKIMVHGMLTVDGVKMSKSRGTFIKARTYLNHLDPMYLRYYFACKLSPQIRDIDLNFDDFEARVNADLIGKITNLASRAAQFLHKSFAGQMSQSDEEGLALILRAQQAGEAIADYFEKRDFQKAMTAIREIADEANQYVDKYVPWQLVKTNPALTQSVLTTALNLFRIMAIYLKPIIPQFTTKVEALFGETPYQWQDSKHAVFQKTLHAFHPLATRIDKKHITAMIEETKKEHASMTEATTEVKPLSLKPEITIDDVQKLDLKVGKVIAAQDVPKANKLLQLTVDLGAYGTKQIFSGIKSHYKAEDMVGMHVVVVANLKPRQMTFGLSEGMILAASHEKDLVVLQVPLAKPGSDIS